MEFNKIILFAVLLTAVCCAGFNAKDFFVGQWEIEMEEQLLKGQDQEPKPLLNGKFDFRLEEETVVGEFYEKAINDLADEEDFQEAAYSDKDEPEELEEEEELTPSFYIKIEFESETSGSFYKSSELDGESTLMFNFDFENVGNYMVSYSQYKPENTDGPVQKVQFLPLSGTSFLVNIVGQDKLRIISGVKPQKKPGLLARFGPMALMLVMMIPRFFMNKKGQQRPAQQPQAQPQGQQQEEQGNDQNTENEITEESKSGETVVETNENTDVVEEVGEEN
ncbi:hypothetical protein M0812_08350 [Anaeramoeba flamelloides]|uniref:Uncharacterized protein n=1 Tax=Anaeramoeba flamelloides TaxID=1746091 RepID=A0AAV7ZYX5_9EUKA|nr:hypothetical protein M0812_08350 [Anaeramoeba flamelloides]|eukprot:Anaeramoba_flamelloidesa567825_404.p1 GENE.a567825_404~~a567825_404.p1  ORF type:complete len:279 (+),score=93.10 a567825_404:13-849(+)